MFALAGIPAQAQSNLYGNGQTFYVPFVSGASRPSYSPERYYVNMTLNNGSTGTFTTPFTVDTGSLGMVASGTVYKPNTQPGGDTYLGQGTITYSSDGVNPTGGIYLTTVTINGQGSNATARVPVLAASSGFYAQAGVGFARGGLTLDSGGNPAYNLNPFLGLTSVNGQSVANMNPGYTLSTVGFTGVNGQSYGPGVLLGLSQQSTAGFSMVQLTPNTSVPALPPGCVTAGMGCPASWNPQTANVTVGGTSVGTINMLPDSGLSYMILTTPNAGNQNATNANCSSSFNISGKCLPPNTQVQIVIPGTATVLQYTVTVGGSGNPQPLSVELVDNANAQLNNGSTFFNAFDYFYDPIYGFVGYRSNGSMGSNATIVPMLALQGTFATPNGFFTSLPTYLMAPLTLSQTGSGTFAGAIMGAGGLTLNSGSVTLAAANTYTGGTTVNGGTLNVSGSIVGDLTVGTSGTFNNSGTVSSGSSWILNQGSFANSGTVAGNLANVSMATNTGTLAGSVINGAAGSFVNNGQVTGSFANLGVLSGSGTIGGSLSSSGVLAPGNSIGTINVAGNFAQASTGTFLTEVAGAGLSDRINVGGTATVGGQVVVSALPGMTFAPSTTYTILNATGGLSGTFASVNELYPFLLSSLSYDANNVYLTLDVGGFAAAAATPTQAAVGNVLDANVNTATGDFATVLGAMATGTFSNAQAQATLQAISGNNYAGFSTSMVQGMQLFMNNFANQTGGGSPASNRVALAEACDVACDATTPPKWGAWGGALGGLGTIGANQPVGSVTYNAGGFAAGLDRSITDSFRMGVTAGYSTGTQWVSGFDGMGRSNTFQVGLYGGFAQDKVYADAVIGYAYTSNQMWRNIAVPGLQPRTAYGQTGANQWYGQLETGYRFDIGTAANAFVTPFVRLQAYTANQAAFTETGAQSLNLSVGQQTTNSLRSVIGAQLGGSMDLGWREKLAMQLRLGWSHEYADTARPVSAILAGAPAMPFTTFGVAPQRDGVVIGLSANTAIAEATSIYLRYEGDISGQDSAHAITAGVRMTW